MVNKSVVAKSNEDLYPKSPLGAIMTNEKCISECGVLYKIARSYGDVYYVLYKIDRSYGDVYYVVAGVLCGRGLVMMVMVCCAGLPVGDVVLGLR
jgi:hypothetical protein